ncbi:conserved hypothetical protein [Ricinus communis]|uniref:Uncharacterized protein n=1 Tax=Ricinus communis TaxID=3988 RepID=B9RBV6_RICCO|nr:conserved hypothetical protein [Ricinus communis]
MALVWQYGEKSGFESWKGLSWGMVPLLGGAFCACTWHFFYNAESLEVLVALQAALTVIGKLSVQDKGGFSQLARNKIGICGLDFGYGRSLRVKIPALSELYLPI